MNDISQDLGKKINFLTNISFNEIDPLLPLKMDIPSDIRNILELENTILPYDYEQLSSRFKHLQSVPRMSTFAIFAIINHLVSSMPYNLSYVNVGVWHGFSLLSGMVGNPNKKCIGIDNFSQFGGPREEFMSRFNNLQTNVHEFYDMDYKLYFSSIEDGTKQPLSIGLYFYDGAHDYSSQLNGLYLADKYILSGGYILVDDTNWPDPYNATLDFLKGTNGSYQLILDQKTAYNGHPTYWNGLMILRKY